MGNGLPGMGTGPGIPADFLGVVGELQSHWDRPQGVAKASPELGAAGPRDSWVCDTHSGCSESVGLGMVVRGPDEGITPGRGLGDMGERSGGQRGLQEALW